MLLTNGHEVDPTTDIEPSTASSVGQVVIEKCQEAVTDTQKAAYNRFWQLVIGRTTNGNSNRIDDKGPNAVEGNTTKGPHSKPDDPL